MEKQEIFKKYLQKTSIIIFLLIVIFLTFQYLQYQRYVENINLKINSILITLKDKYPKITKNELIELLQSKKSDTTFITEYGIDIKKESIILKNDVEFKRNLLINLVLFMIIIQVLVYSFLKYNKQKDKKIEEMIKLIENINHKNYQLELDDMEEDQLSILKNEIYKTTLMLKEQAEKSMKDKQDMKEALSNISHQLKTPLTSILILLDDLIDYPSMTKETREEFLFDIKRNIKNIYFLVENILKLSKLDSNTILFNKEWVLMESIIREAILNVQSLCDLKNIQMVTKLGCNNEIFCDKKWQVEAFTNILKNSIEHSKNNSRVEIECTQNRFYTTIIVKDFGSGIKRSDLPHIFERFYKGENANKESVGIGLALSKKIIETDSGKINVTSNSNGTTFQIEYFRG